MAMGSVVEPSAGASPGRVEVSWVGIRGFRNSFRAANETVSEGAGSRCVNALFITVYERLWPDSETLKTRLDGFGEVGMLGSLWVAVVLFG